MVWRVKAKPSTYQCDEQSTALIMIDMQRDFLEPGGFGEALGNDVSTLTPVIAVCKDLLELARESNLTIVHTREGHLPDLSDLPETKRNRGEPGQIIGDLGPLGRILIRGSSGHSLLPELAPEKHEYVIDKPGKGAFFATDLQGILERERVTSLILSGVTTEVCVHSTVREANDRGYDCLVIGDACGSYFPDFHSVALKMISAQGGIFGKVTNFLEFSRAVSE